MAIQQIGDNVENDREKHSSGSPWTKNHDWLLDQDIDPWMDGDA